MVGFGFAVFFCPLIPVVVATILGVTIWFFLSIDFGVVILLCLATHFGAVISVDSGEQVWGHQNAHDYFGPMISNIVGPQSNWGWCCADSYDLTRNVTGRFSSSFAAYFWAARLLDVNFDVFEEL